MKQYAFNSPMEESLIIDTLLQEPPETKKFHHELLQSADADKKDFRYSFGQQMKQSKEDVNKTNTAGCKQSSDTAGMCCAV